MSAQTIKKIIQYCAIAFFLLLIFNYFQSHKDEINVLRNLSVADIAILLAINIIAYGVYSLNIFLILRTFESKAISYKELYSILIISRFVNYFITQGANLYSSVRLKKDYDFPYEKFISLVTFFGWYQIVITVSISSLVFVFVNAKMADTYSINIVVLLAVILSLLTVPLIMKLFIRYFAPQTSKFHWIGEKISNVIKNFYSISTNSRLLICISILISVHYMLFLLFVYKCLASFGTPLRIEQLALFTTILILSNTLTIIPGNLGLTEYICGYTTHKLSLRLGDGVFVALLTRIIDFIFISIFCLINGKTLIPQKILKNIS